MRLTGVFLFLHTIKHTNKISLGNFSVVKIGPAVQGYADCSVSKVSAIDATRRVSPFKI